mgnify:CR=1 FL=1
MLPAGCWDGRSSWSSKTIRAARNRRRRWSRSSSPTTTSSPSLARTLRATPSPRRRSRGKAAHRHDVREGRHDDHQRSLSTRFGQADDFGVRQQNDDRSRDRRGHGGAPGPGDRRVPRRHRHDIAWHQSARGGRRPGQPRIRSAAGRRGWTTSRRWSSSSISRGRWTPVTATRSMAARAVGPPARPSIPTASRSLRSLCPAARAARWLRPARAARPRRAR